MAEVELKQEAPVEVKPVKKVSRKGVVAHCLKLNVRRKPSVESDICCVIGNGQKVIILSDKDKLFYQVNVEGTEGYCMKKFIDEVK